LEFEIELLKAQQPGEFQKELWEMSRKDKFEAIPVLKEKANEFYRQQRYVEAAQQYAIAITCLESLSVFPVEEDTGQTTREAKQEMLKSLNILCRLNFAACKLKTNEYNLVIEQCSEILKEDPKNPKALFRRGVAYSRLGRDLELARQDFKTLLEMNEAVPEVTKEMNILERKFQLSKEKEKRMCAEFFSS